jgi:predicted Zn-dependent protease
VWLLDFFAKLEAAAGANPLLGWLQTHPNPGGRIFVVQTTASAWHLQHPG